MGKKWVVVLLGSLLLCTGSINTLITKIQYEIKAQGRPAKSGETNRYYEHPWVTAWLMFIGETLCLFIFFIQFMMQRRSSNSGTPEIKLEWKSQLILVVPTLCDFVSTVLSSIGLLWVDSSVYQMLRGSLIIFVGIMSRLIFKRVLTKHQWGGIISSCLGVIVVSLASILGNVSHKSDTIHVIMGILLILIGQFITSLQMVLEEILLKRRKLQPLNVVGMEGAYGFILCSTALVVTYFLPGTSGPDGRQEDALDAFKQLSNSPTLLATSIIYMMSISIFNFSGTSLTKTLSATNRTLLDTCRTCVVWGVGVILYYGFGLKDYGEALDNWSITKVDGFILLIIGTVFYNMSNERESTVPRLSHISVSSLGNNAEDPFLLDVSSFEHIKDHESEEQMTISGT